MTARRKCLNCEMIDEYQVDGVLELIYIGIDIGSTASKTVVMNRNKVEDAFTLPTGWNGRETLFPSVLCAPCLRSPK